jgi:hypothetical protein
MLFMEPATENGNVGEPEPPGAGPRARVLPPALDAGREPKPGLQWQNNLTLILGVLSLALIAIRLLTVAGFDPETAYDILQAEGTGDVIVGSLVSIVGLIFAPVGFILLYTYRSQRRSVPRKPYAHYQLLGGLSLVVLTIFMSPFFVLLVSVIIVVIATLLSRSYRSWAQNKDIKMAATLLSRLYRRSSQEIEKVTPPPVSLGLEAILIYAVAVIVIGFGSNNPWIPSQIIAAKHHPIFTGYVLSEANGELTILIRGPIEVVEISSQNVTLSECRPSRYFWEQETFGEFIAFHSPVPWRSGYPDCPLRNRP